MSRESPRARLEKIASDGLFRRLVAGNRNPEHFLHRNGRALLDFASNDYLGLSTHPAIANALVEGVRRYGTGASASRLVTGTHAPHEKLEEIIADAKGTEAALVFTSGYVTAISTIPVIAGKGDHVILDRLAHASLIDAARISAASLRVFPHNDHRKLSQILEKIRSRDSESRILVVTESIFSMDGDECPLGDIVTACERWEADLFLDEAHATGVLGESGMGLAEKSGFSSRIAFQMGTMSKAPGVFGGYIAASRDWIDLFVNQSRPFIYTTAIPPAFAQAAVTAFEIIRSGEGKSLRSKLRENSAVFGSAIHPAAIIPIVLGTNEAAKIASSILAEHGFFAPAIRFPTVPKGSSRLRITLSAAHRLEDVERLRKILMDEIHPNPEV